MNHHQEQLIVVGIDGSPESLAALRWALREAVATNCSVEVVHCWLPHTITDVVFGSAEELHRGSICMLQNEIQAALAQTPHTPEVRQTSKHGRAVPTLLDRASSARLLVLGSHGHGFHKTGFGHVVAACLRHATCPVVVVDHVATVLEHTGRAVTGAGRDNP